MTSEAAVPVYGYVDGKYWVTEKLVQCPCGMGAIEIDAKKPKCSNCRANWNEFRAGLVEEAKKLRDARVDPLIDAIRETRGTLQMIEDSQKMSGNWRPFETQVMRNQLVMLETLERLRSKR